MARFGRYRRIEIQVGIFALLGILVLVFGILWLRDFRFAKQYNVYKVFFTDTGGLVPGDIVMVSGFRKGVVRSMELLELGVEVELAVEHDVALRRDARAIIGTRGMLGDRFVGLSRGQAEEMLQPGSMLKGDLQVGMAELMAGTGELVNSARLASEDVRKILTALSDATQNVALTQGIEDASVAAAELRKLLESNRKAFDTSMENFRVASENLAGLTGSTHEDVGTLVRDMRSAATKLDGLMDSLDATAEKADQVATRLLEEDTTLGRLVNDSQLYDNLERVTARADSLVAEIQAHPRRFFKLSLF